MNKDSQKVFRTFIVSGIFLIPFCYYISDLFIEDVILQGAVKVIPVFLIILAINFRNYVIVQHLKMKTMMHLFINALMLTACMMIISCRKYLTLGEFKIYNLMQFYNLLLMSSSIFLNMRLDRLFRKTIQKKKNNF